ncbi:VOC family protein [Candidatus Poriferisodalis sp.]|uniref:VOC family protein n=1 Tax=Candidatus Poriferisodalis sp. TaxID=3101277 RepID=UPI003C6F1266
MSESAPDTPDSTTETGSQLRAVGVTIDCSDPERIADFWQVAVGFARRVGNGRPYITLSDAGGGRMLNHLTIQRVPEAKTAKLRAHLDLFTRDMDTEVARLVALGANVLVPASTQTADSGSGGHLGFRATVMADPEGSEFCVVSRGT